MVPVLAVCNATSVLVQISALETELFNQSGWNVAFFVGLSSGFPRLIFFLYFNRVGDDISRGFPSYFVPSSA